MADLCVNLVPLFNALPQDEKIQIERLVQHKKYQKGEIVIAPMMSANLIIVANGNAKQYTLDEDGNENVLEILHTGDYVGESWLFGQENINNYVDTTEDSEICLLKRQDLLKLMNEQPELSVKLLELNVAKVVKMQTQIHLLTLPKIEDRLLKYLQMYANEINKNNFNLPLKMKDLALYLGTTPETLSRKFALLEKRGQLKRKLRQIELFE
ncbi:MAG: Crp/Fnr family transcriptional regulator [Lactobacillus sp.]|jgi:CRP/FNR family transcriptional regulator|nr:Crp/Fnr family transcriptional regulator [Lactobacillus sp.]MCH3906263.1 Crp/Fnr family transcriptional regulator [Lactobacillus sp.]MCI1466781.1 Crp/Fnr family transcriptional regulator [Lactobacillus sp.]MCI1481599.1 Crp/Fnr family transcriptional regulator [Lactobacillus sp.]MCI1883587.1 Crp/Fnr family transcriptional regulator [Lactobacillus sp.]